MRRRILDPLNAIQFHSIVYFLKAVAYINLWFFSLFVSFCLRCLFDVMFIAFSYTMLSCAVRQLAVGNVLLDVVLINGHQLVECLFKIGVDF